MSVADAGNPLGPSETIVRTVLLTALPNVSWMQLESVVWRHAAPKLGPNIWPRVNGTHKHARNGTHRSNQTGLPAKYSRDKSSRYSQRCHHPLLRDESRFRAGTLGASARATARIRGTGWRWQG